MKKLLLITHSFPPLLEARAIQISKIVRHLHTHGWQATILTVDPNQTPIGQDATLKQILPKDLTTIQTNAFEPQLVISILARLAPSLLAIPDKQIGWYPYAIKAAKQLLQTQQFDLIFTNAKPFTCHLIGQTLHQQYQIPWVAYFSDPWVDNPYFSHIGNWQVHRNRVQETKVLETADGLIFNNTETAHLMLGNINERTLILPHCYDPDLYDLAQLPNVADNTHLRIVHTGNFYGIRSPLPLLRALKILKSKLPPYKVLFVGKIDPQHQRDIQNERLGSELDLVGSVSYLESLAYTHQANLLVTIDAPTSEPSVFFPSKLVDYLGTGKTILGITPPNSTTHRILKEHDHNVADVNKPDEIAQVLMQCLQTPQSPFSIPSVFHAHNVTQRLTHFFNDLTKA